MSVTDFPFLSELEFTTACMELQEQSGYTFFAEAGPALRLTKVVQVRPEQGEGKALDYEDDAIEDNDEAALPRSRRGPQSLVITFDIILSPSYRVPVVFLQPKMSSGECQLSYIEQLYDYIIPRSHRGAIQGTGVYGALSMTVRTIF